MTDPKQDVQDVRAQFEAWMTDDGKHLRAVERNASGEYILMATVSDWEAWQAAPQSPAVRELVSLSLVIDAEFRSDPMAAQCFDLGVLKRWQAALRTLGAGHVE